MGKRRIREILAMGLVAFGMQLALCSQAFPEIRIDRLRFYPELALSETYRSNIYQTGSATKSDFITTTRPGARLEYQFGANHLLSLGYNAGLLSYAHNSSNNYWDQRGNGLLNLKFASGLEFLLSDAFTKSTYERSGTVQYLRPYDQNTANASAAYRFADRWKAEAKYRRDDLSLDHAIDKPLDYVQQLVGGATYYRFTARTSALLEYDYVTKVFQNDRRLDYKETLVYTGVAFDPAAKLHGDFKAGYGWLKFDQPAPGSPTSRNNWVLAVNLTENFTTSTSLSFTATRAYLNDVYNGNQTYVTTTAGTRLEHFFTGKMGGFAAVSYANNAYLDEQTEPLTGIRKKRTDKVWNLGTGLIYNVQKWLETRLEYAYLSRDSNFLTLPSSSFNENRVMLKVVLTIP